MRQSQRGPVVLIDFSRCILRIPPSPLHRPGLLLINRVQQSSGPVVLGAPYAQTFVFYLKTERNAQPAHPRGRPRLRFTWKIRARYISDARSRGPPVARTSCCFSRRLLLLFAPTSSGNTINKSGSECSLLAPSSMLEPARLGACIF